VTSEHDETLKEAWTRFCHDLESVVDIVFRDTSPPGELDRATGVRYIARYVTRALEMALEHSDPRHAQLRVLQTPTNKTFGDNPDCTYWEATVDGALDYRLVGNRGDVHWVRFMAIGADGAASVIRDEDLRTEWDGSFVITIGPASAGPNHLHTEPGPVRLFIRQFFGRWDTETPMRGFLERVGAVEPPPPLAAKAVAEALEVAVAFIKSDSERWYGYLEYFHAWPNQFVAGSPPWAAPRGDTTKMQTDSGRWVHFCQYNLGPEEALVVTVRPPRCRHWILELGNFWMNSTDYRYHLSSINREQAVAQPDGSYVVVVANEDPGVANWLDPAGHRNGLLINRWVDAVDANPLPEAEVVELARLHEVLPAGTPMRDSQERQEQLRRMRHGVARRFPIG
jgi:hypothetical protein